MGRSKLEGVSEGQWAVFAEKVVKERDEALEERARFRDEAEANLRVLEVTVSRAEKAEAEVAALRDMLVREQAQHAEAANARDDWRMKAGNYADIAEIARRGGYNEANKALKDRAEQAEAVLTNEREWVRELTADTTAQQKVLDEVATALGISKRKDGVGRTDATPLAQMVRDALAAEQQEYGLLRVAYEQRGERLTQCEAALAAERERVAGLVAALSKAGQVIRLAELGLSLPRKIKHADLVSRAERVWSALHKASEENAALADAAPVLAAHVEAATAALRGVVATVNRERDEAREEAHRNVEKLRAERDALAAALESVKARGGEIDRLKAEVERLTRERDEADEAHREWMQAAEKISAEVEKRDSKIAVLESRYAALREVSRAEVQASHRDAEKAEAQLAAERERVAGLAAAIRAAQVTLTGDPDVVRMSGEAWRSLHRALTDAAPILAAVRARVRREALEEAHDIALEFAFAACERHCPGHHESEVGEAIAAEIADLLDAPAKETP